MTSAQAASAFDAAHDHGMLGFNSEVEAMSHAGRALPASTPFLVFEYRVYSLRDHPLDCAFGWFYSTDLREPAVIAQHVVLITRARACIAVQP